MNRHLVLAALTASLTTTTALRAQTLELTPPDGATRVASTRNVLTIRFPEPMDRRAGYSVCGGGPSFPEIQGIEWKDDRTLLLKVRLEPDRRYRMPINCAGSGRNFRTRDGDVWPETPWSFWTEQTDEIDPATIERNEAAISSLLTALEARYSYRDRVVTDWPRVFEDFRPTLRGARDPIAFAMRAGEMLSAAEDSHLWMQVDGQTIVTHHRRFTPNFDFDRIRSLVSGLRQVSPTVVRGQIGQGDEGIDYLLITSWSGQHPEHVDAAVELLEELAPRDRPLILDVRPNGGGDERLGRKVARWFVTGTRTYAHQTTLDEETGGFDQISSRTISGLRDDEAGFGAEVCVLMGPQCVSSNEAFLLMMRQADRATLIGDRSGGSSGNPQPIGLGNGVTAMLPSWRALDADRRPIEGVGIEPDQRVAFDATHREVEGDPVLAAAIERLRRR